MNARILLLIMLFPLLAVAQVPIKPPTQKAKPNVQVKPRPATPKKSEPKKTAKPLPAAPAPQESEQDSDQPTFPGGEDALMSYISNNLKYPVSAMEAGVEGMVVVAFTVEANGSVDDVQVTSSLNSACDKEAVRLVKAFPKWHPARKNGEAMSVRTSLPFRFKLTN